MKLISYVVHSETTATLKFKTEDNVFLLKTLIGNDLGFPNCISSVLTLEQYEMLNPDTFADISVLNMLDQLKEATTSVLADL